MVLLTVSKESFSRVIMEDLPELGSPAKALAMKIDFTLIGQELEVVRNLFL